MHATKLIRNIITTAIIGLPTTNYAELPELGDPTQQEFTPYNEHLMGENFYRTIKASVPFVHDLEVNDYISNLGQKLISHSSQPDKKIRIFVIKVSNINAFAGPDANIGFHTGLIIAAKNESELAGVMAHEISHVTQRHLARAITGSGSNPVTMLATILAGILVASQNPQAGAAIIYGGTAAQLQSQINFTRANEHEADRIGIDVLKKSGINPMGMASFFETLLQQSESNNVMAQMEYLRTHPLSTTRIAEARNRITENDKKLPVDNLDFQFVRARLIVQLQKPAKTLVKQLELLPKSQINTLSQYTLGLAYISNKQTGKAITLLKKLSKKNNHPWIKLALADAYLDADKPSKANKILGNLNTLLPNYLPVSIRYAQTLIKLHQSPAAITVLNSQLRTKKQSVVYNTLAKAYFANGQTAAALEATSYEYEKEGYINLAIQQINNALQQPKLKNLTIQRLESRKDDLLAQVGQQSHQGH